MGGEGGGGGGGGVIWRGFFKGGGGGGGKGEGGGGGGGGGGGQVGGWKRQSWEKEGGETDEEGIVRNSCANILCARVEEANSNAADQRYTALCHWR